MSRKKLSYAAHLHADVTVQLTEPAGAAAPGCLSMILRRTSGCPERSEANKGGFLPDNQHLIFLVCDVKPTVTVQSFLVRWFQPG